MTDIPPQDDEGVDWGSVLVITQAQKDAIDADPDVKAAWRELPEGVLVGELGQEEQEDGSIVYSCSHPSIGWDTAETLLEVADTPAVAAEVKAERAKGGKWQAEARGKVKAAVERRPKVERDRRGEANKTGLDNSRKGRKKEQGEKPKKKAAKKANGVKRP